MIARDYNFQTSSCVTYELLSGEAMFTEYLSPQPPQHQQPISNQDCFFGTSAQNTGPSAHTYDVSLGMVTFGFNIYCISFANTFSAWCCSVVYNCFVYWVYILLYFLIQSCFLHSL